MSLLKKVSWSYFKAYLLSERCHNKMIIKTCHVRNFNANFVFWIMDVTHQLPNLLSCCFSRIPLCLCFSNHHSFNCSAKPYHLLYVILEEVILSLFLHLFSVRKCAYPACGEKKKKIQAIVHASCFLSLIQQKKARLVGNVLGTWQSDLIVKLSCQPGQWGTQHIDLISCSSVFNTLLVSGELLQASAPSWARRRFPGCSKVTFHLSTALRTQRLKMNRLKFVSPVTSVALSLCRCCWKHLQ